MSFRRAATLGVLALCACGIEVPDPPLLQCDASRPCRSGRSCVDGICLDDSQLTACDRELGQTPNLFANPSFEDGTAGFRATGGTIELADDGLAGAHALRAVGGAAAAYFGVDDHPTAVENSGAAGTRYCYSAWVRSDTDTSLATIDVREFDPSATAISNPKASVSLSPSWQRLTVDFRTVGAGSFLDLFILVNSPVKASERFVVDVVGIHEGS